MCIGVSKERIVCQKTGELAVGSLTYRIDSECTVLVCGGMVVNE